MRALLNSFTAGLLDETLAGRVDLPNLSRGALRLDNFMPRITGGLTRRPGTLFHGELLGECRLIPFNFSRTQRFQLEAGEGSLRVWKDGVLQPLDYAAPWTSANIHRWHFVQINDVCFLSDRENEPQILTRRGDNDWLLENWNERTIAEPNGWPAMRDENATGTTLALGAVPVPFLEIDTLIAGLTANDSTKLVFSTQDHATPSYVRSAGCWAASIDLTCASPWNSLNANLWAGTAITPRHIVMANHAYVQHGATIRFITMDGTVVERTHVNSVRVGTTDIRIGILDSDLPATITPAKLLPDGWASWFAAEGMPLLFLDQEEKALVADLSSITATRINLAAPTDAQRLAFNEPAISGDSSNPIFMIVGGEPVLLGCFFTDLMAPSLIGDNRQGVMDAIATLGACGHAPENVRLWTPAAAAATGSSVSLTASADVFDPADVGGFYELAHRLDVPVVEISLSDGSGVASAVLTLTAIAVAGTQFSIGSGDNLRVYTWVAETGVDPGPYQVRIGASGAEGSAANAIKAILGTVHASVGPGTLAHPLVTARTGGIFASGVPATGRLTFTNNNLTDGTDDEFRIDGPTHDRTYVFKDTLTGAAYEVKRGANLAASISNAIKAVMASGVAGTDYGTGTVAHADVTAVLSVAPNAIDFTAVVGGVAGNAIATTVDHTSRMSWGASTLLLGEDSNSAKLIIEAKTPGDDGDGIPVSENMTVGSWNAAATDGGATITPTSATLRVNGSGEVFTHGAWWGTLLLETETTPGVWETYRSWTSRNDDNFSASFTLSGEQPMRLRFTGSGTDARAELRMTDSLIRGLVRITAVTDAQNAVCDVVRQVYSPAATVRWSECAWSDRRGWPRTLALFEQSLVFAGTDSQPQKVWSSAKGDLFNFRRDGLSDSAWEYQIAALESSPVVWLAASSFGLVVGTEKEEWVLTGGDNGPITPTNTPQSMRYTGHGAAGIQVGLAGAAMLFVQAGARNVLEYVYDNDRRGFIAPDLSELVEEAMASGIRQLAWQRAPFNAVWAVMEDGGLMSLTYRREKEVVAWAAHPMPGATVESACVTNGDDGLDEVWLAVLRTVNGVPVRYLEKLDSATHLAQLRGERELFTYLDCAKRVTGASATSFAGFDHLEGELVQVSADFSVHPDVRVTGGVVNLQRAATNVLAGLKYTSAVMPMPIEAQMQDGTSQGRRYKFSHLAARYWRTAAASYTAGPKTWPEVFRDSTSVADAPPPLFSGVKRVAAAAGYADNVELTISTSDAEPLNLVWITPVFSVHGE